MRCVRRFAGALGLRGVEDASRWCIPLARGPAARAREVLEADPRAIRASFQGICDAIAVEIDGARVSYLLAGTARALHRVLVIDAIDPLAALDALQLGELGRAPSPDAIARDARAWALARRSPAPIARQWLDGEHWPPDAGTLDDIELRAPPPFAWDPPPCFLAARDAPSLAVALREGLWCGRWRLLTSKQEPAGASPDTDLASGGASFVFARLLGGNDPFAAPYAVILDPSVLSRAWIIDADRWGSHGALPSALSDRDVAGALARGDLPALHEVLIPDYVPASSILRVHCRDARAKEALGELPAIEVRPSMDGIAAS